MEIPYEKLSDSALIGIIEEFISREGTDYGMKEYSFSEKVESVKSQIKSGYATIVYNINDNTVNIVAKPILSEKH